MHRADVPMRVAIRSSAVWPIACLAPKPRSSNSISSTHSRWCAQPLPSRRAEPTRSQPHLSKDRAADAPFLARCGAPAVRQKATAARLLVALWSFAYCACSPAPAAHGVAARSEQSPTRPPAVAAQQQSDPGTAERRDSKRTLNAVVQTPSGAHVLELPAEILVSDVRGVLMDAHESGYGDIEIVQDGASATMTGPPPLPVAPGGEMVLSITADHWSLEWQGSKQTDNSYGTFRRGGIRDEMRRRFASSWSTAPCDLTVVASDEASFSRVVTAVLTYFDVRSCPRELSLGRLQEGLSVAIWRVQGERWRAKGRPLTLRVPALPVVALPEVAVREERKLRVAGVTERWRIVWRDTPEPVCAAEGSFPCVCTPFELSESGEADVVRSRPGQADDVFPLSKLFTGELDAPTQRPSHSDLRRWPVRNGDIQMARDDRERLSRSVRARPPVTLMQFGDYNHDGWATEFELPIGKTFCHNFYSVVIGITPRRRVLHAFGSDTRPESPLVLGGGWSKLLKTRGKVRYVDLSCGFRDTTTQVEVELHTAATGVHAVAWEYACDEDRRQGLLRKREF